MHNGAPSCASPSRGVPPQLERQLVHVLPRDYRRVGDLLVVGVVVFSDVAICLIHHIIYSLRLEMGFQNSDSAGANGHQVLSGQQAQLVSLGALGYKTVDDPFDQPMLIMQVHSMLDLLANLLQKLLMACWCYVNVFELLALDAHAEKMNITICSLLRFISAWQEL